MQDVLSVVQVNVVYEKYDSNPRVLGAQQLFHVRFLGKRFYRDEDVEVGKAFQEGSRVRTIAVCQFKKKVRCGEIQKISKFVFLGPQKL